MEISSIWTEKYRPKKFSEIYGQKEIVERVEAFVKRNNLPNQLYAGPAGVGKTTLILVAARELYGDYWRQNTLELNASDDRGIDVVREQIKDFAKTMPFGGAKFKLIILDEADSLTKEAQQALRRTMENYVDNCRFCLLANYSSKLIDPIQSRCTVFRFKPLGHDELKGIVVRVAESEGLEIGEKAVSALHAISGGDVRRMTNILQSCAAVKNIVSEELIYELVSAAQPQEIREVLELAVSSKFLQARKQLLDVMLKHGLSGIDVVKQIQKEIWALPVDDQFKVKLIDRCGEIEFRMVEGADEFVQLEALLASFIR